MNIQVDPEPATQQGVSIHVGCSPQLKQKVNERAEQSGLKTSEYIRAVLSLFLSGDLTICVVPPSKEKPNQS